MQSAIPARKYEPFLLITASQESPLRSKVAIHRFGRSRLPDATRPRTILLNQVCHVTGSFGLHAEEEVVNSRAPISKHQIVRQGWRAFPIGRCNVIDGPLNLRSKIVVPT